MHEINIPSTKVGAVPCCSLDHAGTINMTRIQLEVIKAAVVVICSMVPLSAIRVFPVDSFVESHWALVICMPIRIKINDSLIIT